VSAVHPEVAGQLAAAARGQLLAGWAPALAAVLGLAALGAWAGPAAGAGGDGGAAALAVAGAGVLLGAAPGLLGRTLLAPRRLAGLLPLPDLALALRMLLAAHLVLCTLAVLPALLGFAQLLLGGATATHLALCAVSLVDLALLLPTRERFAARVRTVLSGPAAARKAPAGGAP
jgi:hypothetical protein